MERLILLSRNTTLRRLKGGSKKSRVSNDGILARYVCNLVSQTTGESHPVQACYGYVEDQTCADTTDKDSTSTMEEDFPFVTDTTFQSLETVLDHDRVDPFYAEMAYDFSDSTMPTDFDFEKNPFALKACSKIQRSYEDAMKGFSSETTSAPDARDGSIPTFTSERPSSKNTYLLLDPNEKMLDNLISQAMVEGRRRGVHSVAMECGVLCCSKPTEDGAKTLLTAISALHRQISALYSVQVCKIICAIFCSGQDARFHHISILGGASKLNFGADFCSKQLQHIFGTICPP